MILIINLLIAIMSDTYSRMADLKVGLYWSKVIKEMPKFKFHDKYGALVMLPFIFSWMGFLFLPLLLAACQPRQEARFVVLHSHDGYTTNLALEDFAADDALLAHSWSGAPLAAEHGGSVKFVKVDVDANQGTAEAVRAAGRHPFRAARAHTRIRLRPQPRAPPLA